MFLFFSLEEGLALEGLDTCCEVAVGVNRAWPALAGRTFLGA